MKEPTGPIQTKTKSVRNSEPKRRISIGWLYPELMSTYGDRGNVIVLRNRLEWRGIRAEIIPIMPGCPKKIIRSTDLIIGGGAQDRQQSIVVKDLLTKRDVYAEMFESGTPGLFVCGAPQLLGHWYMTGSGDRLPGLGIFDFTTQHFGYGHPRCIGNTVAMIDERFVEPYYRMRNNSERRTQVRTIVGFENHGGRTYLGPTGIPFGSVVYGYGNNGEDGTEGAVYRNCIACYYHGPFLARNPHVADWLIATALTVKHGDSVPLRPLDDELEWIAHREGLHRRS